MKTPRILLAALFAACAGSASAGELVPVRIEGNDTIYCITLRDVYVYPKMVFKNARQEKFYWKTVRDVKKTLPYAKIAARVMNDANEHLSELATPKEKREYLRATEADLFRRFEKDLRSMTRSQGKILIRLIDRECSQTSYELIRIYRGSVAAVFWQGVAHLFGTDLKAEYDGEDKDRIIERIIVLVENGQL